MNTMITLIAACVYWEVTPEFLLSHLLTKARHTEDFSTLDGWDDEHAYLLQCRGLLIDRFNCFTVTDFIVEGNRALEEYYSEGGKMPY